MIVYVYSTSLDLSEIQYTDEFNFTDCNDTNPWFFPNVLKKFHMFQYGMVKTNLKMFRKTDFKCFINYLKNAHIIFINDNDVFCEQSLMIAETIYNTVSDYFLLFCKTDFEIPIR